MKLEYEVDTFIVTMPAEYSLPGHLKQYMIHVPKVDSWAHGEVRAELTMEFPDGFESLYKWDVSKNEWKHHAGKEGNTLRFPIPITQRTR